MVDPLHRARVTGAYIVAEPEPEGRFRNRRGRLALGDIWGPVKVLSEPVRGARIPPGSLRLCGAPQIRCCCLRSNVDVEFQSEKFAWLPTGVPYEA